MNLIKYSILGARGLSAKFTLVIDGIMFVVDAVVIYNDIIVVVDDVIVV